MIAPMIVAQTPTAKTLPKGVWKLGYSGIDFDVSRVNAQDKTTNGAFDNIKTQDFAVKHSNALMGVYSLMGGSGNPDNPVDPDVKLANSVEFGYHYLDVGYGVTDKLSVGLRFRYVNKVINYKDEYRDMISATIQGLGGKETANAAGIYEIPKQAKGSGIGDTDLGITYRWTDTFSTALVARAGILKTGTDPKEKADKRDNFEALSTGKAEDIYSLYLMKDYVVNDKLDFTLVGSYTVLTEGYERVLDNNGRIDHGDEVLILINANYRINDTFYISPSLTWFNAGADEMFNKNGDGIYKWETIPNSSVRQLFGKLQLNYKPTIFMHLFAAYETTLDANRSNGLYNVPGRLIADDLYSAGVTLYLK